MIRLSTLAFLSVLATTPASLAQSRETKPPREEKPARQTEPAPQKSPTGFQGVKQMQLGPIDLQQEPFLDRIETTPDVNQHATYNGFLKNEQMDEEARTRIGLPEGLSKNTDYFPNDFCGPSAIANHLMWLDAAGYSNISSEPNAFAAATKLAYNLGWSYMKTVTSPAPTDDDTWEDVPEGKGTTAHDLINGAVKFLKEKNVPVKAVRITSSYETGIEDKLNTRGAPLFIDVEKPSSSTIHDALHRRSIVVTLHGHYAPTGPSGYKAPKRASADSEANPVRWSAPRLERTGGHYAAAVGYGTKKYGDYISDVTLYHDSSARNQHKKFQTVYDWDVVTKDDFATNPVLIRYYKGKDLARENLRCPFAKEATEDPHGQSWSLECRGSLHGHSVAHWRNSERNDKTAELVGGMPHIGYTPDDFNSARDVKVLEVVFEIEVEDPPKKGPGRKN